MSEPLIFPTGSVPVSIVAKVYGKDPAWVRAGIIKGWLPIGIATRGGQRVTELNKHPGKNGRINYYISARKLWEETGYYWKGEQ